MLSVQLPIYTVALTSGETVTLIVALVTAVFAFLGIAVTQWQLRQAGERTAKLEHEKNQLEEARTKLEEEKVDAAAYERARAFDRETVERINRELQEALLRIEAMRRALNQERIEHEMERSEWFRSKREMQVHIDQLERALGRLTQKLRDAGFDVDEKDQVKPFQWRKAPGA